MKKLKHFVLVICLISSSGCSYTADLLFNNEEECEGAACNDTGLSQYPTSDVPGNCYGKEDESDWQCDSEPDSSEIANVADKPTRAGKRPASTPVQRSNPAWVLPAEPLRVQPTVITSSWRVSAISRDSLMEQPRGSFAVQLAALEEKENVFRYAKSNGISEPLYVRISNRGRNWYVLLLGVYENRTAAIEAKESWVRSNNIDRKPWVRNLGLLQDAVRAAADG